MTWCLNKHAASCTFSRFDVLIELSLMMQIISQKTWLFNSTYTLYLPLPQNVTELYRGCWSTALFILDLDIKFTYIIMYCTSSWHNRCRYDLKKTPVALARNLSLPAYFVFTYLFKIYIQSKHSYILSIIHIAICIIDGI